MDYFAKFLVQCVDGARSTDEGVEKAVGVIKWWLVLLRRYWVWKRAADGDRGSKEAREGRDVVLRKKLGG